MTAFNMDEAIADLSKPPVAPAAQPQVPSPPSPSSSQPQPKATTFDIDAAIGDLAKQRKEDDTLSAQFLRYRQQNAAVPGERQAEVFRTAAALRQMGETPDLSYVEKNLDSLKKRAEAHGAKWDELLVNHPGLKDYLVAKPERQDLIADDLKNVDDLAWVLRVPGVVLKKAYAEQKYFARTFAESKGLGSEENRAAIKDLEPTVNAGYGAEHWYSKMYAGTLNMLPMLGRYTLAGIAGAKLSSIAAGPAEAAAAGATAEIGGIGAAPVAIGAAGVGANLATGALSYYETVGPAYQRLINQGASPKTAHILAEAEAGVTSAIFAGALPGLLTKLGLGGKGALAGLGTQTAKVLEQKALPQIVAQAATQYGKNMAHATLMMGAISAVSQSTNEAQKLIDKGGTPSIARIAEATADGMLTALRDMSVISAYRPMREAFSNIGEAAQLARDQEQLTAAFNATEQSKLLDRSPDEFKALIATLGQGGLKNLYTPIEAYNAYWEAKRANPREVAAKLVGDDGASYDHALQTGGDLVIPVENYLSVLGKTEHARGMALDLKIREDGRTPRQEQQRIEKRATELAAIPDAEIRAQEGRNLVERWFRENIDRSLSGNKRIANSDAVADKTAKLQAEAFDRMAQEINKNSAEGTAPVTAWDIFRQKARVEFTGDNGVMAGDIKPSPYADPASLAALGQMHNGLSPTEKAGAYFRDRNTGLLNERGHELRMADPERPMTARFSLPAKAFNDTYGHLTVDGALRVMARVLGSEKIRDAVKRGGDIEADLKDQAQADALAAAMSKALDPKGRIKVLATAAPRGKTTLSTLEALGPAHDKTKSEAIANKVFPERGQFPPDLADKPAELSALAAAWADEPATKGNSDLSQAHQEAFSKLETSRAFFETYRDPSGLLNELGVHRMIELSKPKYVISSDGRAIGKMNAAMGKENVNAVLDTLSEAFSDLGGGEFNIGRLHGDEYGGGGDNLERMKDFFDTVRKHTDTLLLFGKTVDGRFFLQEGIHFDYGIDSNFDRADRIALARAKAERGEVEGPRVFETEEERDAAIDELDAARARKLAGPSDLRPTAIEELSRRRNSQGIQRAPGGTQGQVADGLENLSVLSQPGKGGGRGSISFELPRSDGRPRRYSIDLTGADESTAAHETFHMLTEVLHDVATAPNAPPSLAADYGQLIKWIGHGSPEERVAATRERIALERQKAKGEISPADEKRRLALEAKEERAAAGWEEYLKEGKSPSARLAGVFSRFASWLTKIYRGGTPAEQFQSSYGEELGLTPEVKALFDRLLASDAQLEATRSAIEMQPLPVAHRGMTPEEQQEYADATEKMQAEGHAAMLKAIAKDAKVRSHVVDEERARLTEERNTELDRTPVYRVLTFLQERELISVDSGTGDVIRIDAPSWLKGADGETLRLDRKAVESVLGKGEWSNLPKGTTTAKGGIRPDEVAPFFGFNSGEELLRAMQLAEPRKQVVERDVQAKLNSMFGPTLVDNPSALFDEAVSAEHSGNAAKRIMLEIRSLRRQLHKDIDPRIEAVSERSRKETAQRLIDERKIKELSPGYYRRAEQQAASRALEAAMSGKLEKAMGERETQLLNQYLYRYAREAKEKADHIREQLTKKTTDTYRAALGRATREEKDASGKVVAVHRDYLDAHDALMSAVAIGKRKPQGFKIADLMARMEADAADVNFDTGAIENILSSQKPYDELTTPEAVEVDAAIKNIRASANAVNEITVDGRRVAVKAIVDAIRDGLERLPFLGAEPAAKQQVPALKRAALAIQGLDGGLLDPMTWIGFMGEDAKKFFADRYFDARTKRDKLEDSVLSKIFDAWQELPEEMRNNRHEVIPSLKDELPIKPELNLSDDTGPRDRQWLWMAFLNMGNRGPKSNMERLLKPFDWTEEQMLASIGKHLTPAECEFLQKILDITESLWPEISAKEERKTGLQPEKIKASPITIQFQTSEIRSFGDGGSSKTYGGGYFPARYRKNAAAGDIAERQAEQTIQSFYGPNYERATTPKSHTKARAAGYANVLDLDWSNVTNHLAQVVHDVAFDEYVRDTARVLMHPDLQNSIYQRLGAERSVQPRAWLKAVANAFADSVPESMRWWQRIINPLRSRTVAAAIGGSFRVAGGDLLNAAFAIAEGHVSAVNGTAAMLKGFAQAPLMLVGKSEMRNEALRLSPELQHRSRHSEKRIKEEIERIGKKQGGVASAIDRARYMMYVMFDATDAMSSTQIWWGAFNDAKEKGLDQGASVRWADDKVHSTLPSHDVAEQSALLRDKRGIGSILIFHGFFNKLYNIQRRIAHGAYVAHANEDAPSAWLKTAESTARIAAILALAGPASEFLSSRGKSDDESTWQWVLRKMAGAGLASVPFGGSVAPVADYAITGSYKPASVRSAPGISIVEHAVDEVGKLASSGRETSKRVWDAIELALIAMGGPARQARDTGEYVVKLLQGRAEDKSVPGILSGTLFGERQNQPANIFKPHGRH